MRATRQPREGGSPPAPTEVLLREAALAHLARYGTTAANLVRVLDRRVARWVRGGGAAAEAASLRASVRRIVAALVEAGAVSDQAFAEARTRRLRRAGKSAVATVAHLRARGVPAELAAGAARAGPEAETVAALIALRRRRLGPFEGETTPEGRTRALAMLARAGFGGAVARAAVRLTRTEAEAMIAGGGEGGSAS